MSATYIQGEQAAFHIADDAWSSVSLKYGTQTMPLVKTAGVWSGTVNTSSLSGLYNYAVLADGSCVERGAFYVVQLVSKYRAVIESIDAALQSVAANGKYSISVGEISLTDKTFDEMVKARNYYTRLADADEQGVTPSFGPTRRSEVYSC